MLGTRPKAPQDQRRRLNDAPIANMNHLSRIVNLFTSGPSGRSHGSLSNVCAFDFGPAPSDASRLTVRIITLDDFFAPLARHDGIFLLKIDTEGFDAFVLRGTRRLPL